MRDQLSTAADSVARHAGIPGFPGPFAVGRYAGKLRDWMRERARVCLIGEVTGARVGSGPNVYFELRDADGAIPCAMWREDFERCGLADDGLRDGAQVVVAGRCDYYPGSATSSPRFAFRVSDMRAAGEGDLLERLARLRRQLDSEGLFEPQKRLVRPALPRRIGVVTAEASAARRDFLAALERRSWQGTIVWGYAPVQDRRAAPAIAAAIRDLAALGEVDAIVVTRGGGSIVDLWAFCDELLCRTVALTPVPVISAVGHDVDRTLLDDVAAQCCSTPTHAAEAAVAVDCAQARTSLGWSVERLRVAGTGAEMERDRLLRAVGRLHAGARRAMLERARALAAQSRAPLQHVERQRLRLHQIARELRAASRRGRAERIAYQRRVAAVGIDRKRESALAVAAHARGGLRTGLAELERALGAQVGRRAEFLAGRGAALLAHDPQRALERGYALLLDEAGEPLTSVGAVRAVRRFDMRLTDGTVGAEVAERGER
ncbi:MAG: exodeoxyribonuclease VII large subunit [Thermoleophilaceae bacterium]